MVYGASHITNRTGLRTDPTKKGRFTYLSSFSRRGTRYTGISTVNLFTGLDGRIQARFISSLDLSGFHNRYYPYAGINTYPAIVGMGGKTFEEMMMEAVAQP